MKKQIYLDNAATTRVYLEVAEVVKKAMLEDYGNPSALHELGEKAFKLINDARRKLALEIGAKSHEIVFTSGATESNNLALKGLLKSKKKKIIISEIEHPSVKEVVDFLKSGRLKVIEIGINKNGLIDLNELEKKIDKNTLMVSIMHANNIIGSVQDLEQIGKICKKKKVLFHTDAVQSFGKLKIDVRKMNIDMLSASAHKIGGPKGIGFLYVREGLELKPIIYGGGQERNIRSGTENVPGILGFAKALEITKKIDNEKIRELKNKFSEGLEKIGAKINSPEDSLFNFINFSFPEIDSEDLIYRLSNKSIYVSTGSACDSKKEKENYVLKAIGLNKKEIESSVRITLNEKTNFKDMEFVLSKIEKLIKDLGN